GVRACGEQQKQGLFDSQHYSSGSPVPVSYAASRILLLKVLLFY
ncbi:hypothetical protein LEMLEM_LOCUS16575, partial [Lemmus lemmus]